MIQDLRGLNLGFREMTQDIREMTQDLRGMRLQMMGEHGMAGLRRDVM